MSQQNQSYSKPFNPTKRDQEPSPDVTYPVGAIKMGKAYEKLKNREWKHKFTLPYWKATWAARGASTLILATTGAATIMVALPFLFTQYREILGMDIPLLDRERAMPSHTPVWWLNEWRKSHTPWKHYESWHPASQFYVRLFEFIQSATGRDMLTFPREVLDAEAKKYGGNNNNNSSSQQQLGRRIPRAFVPMCGDSPIVRVLVEAGYDVDAIDSTDVAIRELSDRLDQKYAATPETARRVNLHLQDVFSPFAWKSETGIVNGIAKGSGDSKTGGFDFIWDRQGLSAVDPNRRDDYAFLLKRALKQDGVMYVEGMFRTAKRKKNRENGPSFHFGTEQLEDLFPRSQGYRVKCDELQELTRDDLDSEARVTGIIPDDLLARPFPCVVWRDAKLLADIAHTR